MDLYIIYIVFESGHKIRLEHYKFLENAEYQAKYHAEYSKVTDAWFEVWHCGDMCLSTK